MLNPFVANRPASASPLALLYCTLFRLKNQEPNLTPSLRFAACVPRAELSQLPKRFLLLV
jgi:hypothetical protein